MPRAWEARFSPCKWNLGVFLIVVAGLALGLRLAAVTALRDWTAPPGLQHGHDPVEYNLLALNITAGDGFCYSPGHPTSFRAPGFPLFLAGLFHLGGVSYPAVYVAFGLLGALSAILTYLIGRELVPESTARVAGLLMALYPPGVYMSTWFASENLFIPCLGLGVWAFLKHLKTGRPSWLAAAGGVLGWATLTRPYALLLLPLLLVLLVAIQSRAGRLRPLALGALPLAFLAVVLPWSARNYFVFGRPVLVSTTGGSTFWGGNNDRVLTEPHLLGYWTLDGLPGRERVLASAKDEAERDRLEWQQGGAWARAHLDSLPLLALYKFGRLCLPELDARKPHVLLAQIVACTPFLALAYWGILCSLRRDRRTWTWLVLHLNLLLTVFTALIFFGCPRYRDANACLLMVYAALGATSLPQLWAHFTSKWSSATSGLPARGCGGANRLR